LFMFINFCKRRIIIIIITILNQIKMLNYVNVQNVCGSRSIIITIFIFKSDKKSNLFMFKVIIIIIMIFVLLLLTQTTQIISLDLTYNLTNSSYVKSSTAIRFGTRVP